MAWLQRGKYDAIQDFLLSPALRALPANPQLTPPAPLRCAGGYTLDARSAGSDLFSIECRNSRARLRRVARLRRALPPAIPSKPFGLTDDYPRGSSAYYPLICPST